jgi:hypothetical protein
MGFEANGTGAASRRDRVRELARSDAGKAAGMAVAQLVANGVALTFVVVFARILGDDGYGALGSLLSLFLILYVPGQALQVAVAREVSARVAKGDPDPGAGVRRWVERLVIVTVVVTVISIFARDGLAALIAGHREDWPRLREHVAAGSALPITPGDTRILSGYLVAARALRAEADGDLDRAVEELASWLDPALGYDAEERYMWLPDLVRLALAAGRPETARAAVAASEADATDPATGGHRGGRRPAGRRRGPRPRPGRPR